MKVLSLFLFSAILCSAVQAQNIASAYHPPGRVLNPTSTLLEIHRDGAITATYTPMKSDSEDLNTVTHTIATLDAGVLAKIVKVLSSIDEAPKLRDLNEGEPKPRNLQTFIHFASIKGKSVEIASDSRGHIKIDSSSKTTFLKETLEGLLAFALVP